MNFVLQLTKFWNSIEHPLPCAHVESCDKRATFSPATSAIEFRQRANQNTRDCRYCPNKENHLNRLNKQNWLSNNSQPANLPLQLFGVTNKSSGIRFVEMRRSVSWGPFNRTLSTAIYLLAIQLIHKSNQCYSQDCSTIIDYEMTSNNNSKADGPSPAKRVCAGAAEALRRAEGDGVKYDGDIVRKRTRIEEEVISHEQEAEKIVEALPESPRDIPTIELFMPEVLKDAVFVGHLVTDLDSVAGAIGAAALYGGVPALASEVNSETAFALEYWGIEKPRRVEDILKEKPDASICLVDHQQTSQMNPSIKADQIVGVIDHHALQSKTIVTDKPIYIDIRPWGSMSSIIAHTFLTHRRRPEKGVAGMLLCAILSDTLNLQGPTTTEWDRLIVAVLAEIAEVNNIQLLAQQQFKAKSKELATMSAHALVNGDQKTFSFDASGFTGDIGFAVVETTDDDVILEKTSKLILEMVACKKEKNLSMIFLAVVNIVELKSCLLICGPTEKALAVEAFGGEISMHDTIMDLGNRVSRKKEYIPVITKVINEGWKRPQNLKRGLSEVGLHQLGRLEVDPEDPYGNINRIGSVLSDDEDKHYGAADDCEEKKEDAAFVIG